MSRSIKPHKVARWNNRSIRATTGATALEHIMNLVVSQSSAAEQQATGLSAALASWYAAHASIRRLWAVEDQNSLLVFVTLEPTSDGDDAFPIWIAKSHDWAGDLKTRTSREVELKLIVSGDFEESYVETGATMIAQLSWRDPWS